MAVKIRLKRLGKIRSPHYRIVIMDSRQKRDGRAIEEIGIYHPKNDPSVIEVNSERAQYWLGVGAQPTDAVIALFKRSGDWQKFTGDDSPSGIEPQKPKPDRLGRYSAAIEAAPEVEAIKPKRAPAKKVVEEVTEVVAEVTEVVAEVAEVVADVAEVVAEVAEVVVEPEVVAEVEEAAETAEKTED